MSAGLMVALDLDDGEEAISLAGEIGGSVTALKVGSQLFVREGPDIIGRIREEGADVFLDLKFHDIPNTVKKAVEGIASLGVSWLTIHASGGPDMVAAAKEAAGDARVLAVTVLTSLTADHIHRMGIEGEVEEQVVRLARLARDSGADGIVCSALEVAKLREALDGDCILVTPGIRPAGAGSDDQARVSTPAQAVMSGADYLVVGRPVVKADDRPGAVRRILDEMKGNVP